MPARAGSSHPRFGRYLLQFLPAPVSAAIEERGLRLLESRRGTELESKTHCSVVVTRRNFDLVQITRHELLVTFRCCCSAPDLDAMSVRADGFARSATSTMAKHGLKRNPALQTTNVVIRVPLKLFLAIWATTKPEFVPCPLQGE